MRRLSPLFPFALSLICLCRSSVSSLSCIQLSLLSHRFDRLLICLRSLCFFSPFFLKFGVLLARTLLPPCAAAFNRTNLALSLLYRSFYHFNYIHAYLTILFTHLLFVSILMRTHRSITYHVADLLTCIPFRSSVFSALIVLRMTFACLSPVLPPLRTRQMSSSSPSVSGNRCAACGKSNLKLRRCGQCKAVAYCSKECQSDDWNVHKPRCKTSSAPATVTTTSVNTTPSSAYSWGGSPSTAPLKIAADTAPVGMGVPPLYSLVNALQFTVSTQPTHVVSGLRSATIDDVVRALQLSFTSLPGLECVTGLSVFGVSGVGKVEFVRELIRALQSAIPDRFGSIVCVRHRINPPTATSLSSDAHSIMTDVLTSCELRRADPKQRSLFLPLNASEVKQRYYSLFVDVADPSDPTTAAPARATRTLIFSDCNGIAESELSELLPRSCPATERSFVIFVSHSRVLTSHPRIMAVKIEPIISDSLVTTTAAALSSLSSSISPPPAAMATTADADKQTLRVIQHTFSLRSIKAEVSLSDARRVLGVCGGLVFATRLVSSLLAHSMSGHDISKLDANSILTSAEKLNGLIDRIELSRHKIFSLITPAKHTTDSKATAAVEDAKVADQLTVAEDSVFTILSFIARATDLLSAPAMSAIPVLSLFGGGCAFNVAAFQSICRFGTLKDAQSVIDELASLALIDIDHDRDVAGRYYFVCNAVRRFSKSIRSNAASASTFPASQQRWCQYYLQYFQHTVCSDIDTLTALEDCLRLYDRESHNIRAVARHREKHPSAAATVKSARRAPSVFTELIGFNRISTRIIALRWPLSLLHRITKGLYDEASQIESFVVPHPNNDSKDKSAAASIAVSASSMLTMNRMIHLLGRSYMRMSQFDRAAACYERFNSKLDITTTDNAVSVATLLIEALTEMGVIEWKYRNDHKQAITYFEAAGAAYKQQTTTASSVIVQPIDSYFLEIAYLRSLHMLGLCNFQSHSDGGAVSSTGMTTANIYLSNAITSIDKLRPNSALAATLHHDFAMILNAWGHSSASTTPAPIEHFKKAADIRWMNADFVDFIQSNNQIAAALLKTGNSTSAALNAYERSLAMSTALNGPAIVTAGTEVAIATILSANKSTVPKALQHFENARQRLDKAGAIRELASVLSSIGRIHAASSATSYLTAITCLTSALEIYDKLGDDRNAVTTVNTLGTLTFELKQFDASLNYFARNRAALLKRSHTGDPEALARTDLNLAAIHVATNNHCAAIDLFVSARNHYQKTPTHSVQLVTVWSELANCFRALNRFNDAIEAFDAAATVAAEIGNGELNRIMRKEKERTIQLKTTTPLTPTKPQTIACLIVSKDRAFQLNECLRTLFLCGLNHPHRSGQASDHSSTCNKQQQCCRCECDCPFTSSQQPSSLSAPSNVLLNVTVIYAYSSALHMQAYRPVIDGYPSVRFLCESDPPAGLPFYDRLCEFMTGPAADAQFVLFGMLLFRRLSLCCGYSYLAACVSGVDDMVFYRCFHFDTILTLLSEHQTISISASPQSASAPWSLSSSARLFAYHLCLHPSISYCHTANKVITKPPLLPLTSAAALAASSSSSVSSKSLAADAKQNGGEPLGHMFFERSKGSHDFNYPFSLCASVYNASHVRQLFASLSHTHHTAVTAKRLSKPTSSTAHVDGRWACSHPNRFELYGNRLLAGDLNNPTSLLSSTDSKSKMSGFMNLIAQSQSKTDGKTSDPTAASVSALLSKYIASPQISSANAASSNAAAPLLCCENFRPLISASLSLLSDHPHAACPASPVCSVVTVNRVQNIFKNPVYTATSPSASSTAFASDASGEVNAIAERFRAEPTLRFNLSHYRSAAMSSSFRSVHIPDFVLLRSPFDVKK